MDNRKKETEEIKQRMRRKKERDEENEIIRRNELEKLKEVLNILIFAFLQKGKLDG